MTVGLKSAGLLLTAAAACLPGCNNIDWAWNKPGTVKKAVVKLGPVGTGGEYRDPMNQYFEVQPPVGWQIVEKRDKGTFTFGPGSAYPGRVIARTWITFRNGRASIGVIARESTSTIEEDFPFVLKEYRKRFGGNVRRTGFISIDGVKGAQIIASAKGIQVLLVKYKKHGLDHAITMTCPRPDSHQFAPEFERFLRSYRSLDSTSSQALVQGH